MKTDKYWKTEEVRDTEKIINDLIRHIDRKTYTNRRRLFSIIQAAVQNIKDANYINSDAYQKLLGKISRRIKRYDDELCQLFEEDLQLLLERMSDHYGVSLDMPEVIWCDDGKTYTQRFYLERAYLLSSIEKEIIDDLASGRPVNIEDCIKSSIDRLKRLTDTELEHFYNAMKAEAFEKKNYTHYVYLTSHLENVCTSCTRLDGKIFPISDTAHRPTLHPKCACTIYPITLATKS